MTDKLNTVTTNTLQLFKEKIITLPYFNSSNYLNNVKSLQIKVTDEGGSNFARYIVFSNTVLISSSSVTEYLLLHELIHMASANRLSIDQMSYQMGYQIVTPKTKNITALNEGLTQLLVCNAIDGDDSNNYIYPIETRIARMLTYIFGEKEIYGKFFEAKPQAFIESIMNKTKNNSIATCIVKMDELLLLLKSSNVTDFNEECSLLLFEIQKQVVNMFLQMYEEKTLNYDEFSKLLITPNVDNVNLKFVANNCEYKIDEYLKDNIKKK